MSQNKKKYSEDETLSQQQQQQQQNEQASPLLTMTTEKAIEYLNEKYRHRYTMNDPLFVEALERKVSIPPIEINYFGRIKRYHNHHQHHNRDQNRQQRE